MGAKGPMKKVRVTVSTKKARELKVQATYEIILGFLKNERRKLKKKIQRINQRIALAVETEARGEKQKR